MRISSGVLMLLFPCVALLPAQSFEAGGAAGYGFSRNVSVAAPSGGGETGFKSGVAVGGVFANDLYGLIGGEIRYTYQRDDLKVSSGGTTVTSSGDSHALHYDVLIHAASKEAAVRPFLAMGAGVKIYRGMGAEPVYQPLSNLIVLTRTNQTEPLLSIGGGVKIAFSERALLRLDFRDYATPFPSNLLASPLPSSAGGWIHNFVFLVGVSRVF